MRHLTAIAIVPALAAMMLAGCGGPSRQEMAQNAIRHGYINGSTSKQSMIAGLIGRPEQRDTMTVAESDRIVRLIAADRAIAYGLSDVSQADRDAIIKRYAELPSAEEYRLAHPSAEQQKAAAETKAKDDAAARFAAAPVLDYRARFAAAREYGVTIASPSSPSMWSAVEGTDGRDMRGVYVEGGVAYAWGPTGGAISRDGSETWEANDVAAIAGVVHGGKVFALDADGGIVSEEGFEYGADLPRYESIGVSGGSLVATSKTKLAYLRLDGAVLTEAAKFDRAQGSFVAGWGKQYVYLVSPAGTVTAYNRERGAMASLPMRPSGLNPVGKPPAGYRPIAAVPIPHAIGGEAAFVDGGVDLLVDPRTNLAGWCVVNAGDVVLAVNADGSTADLIGSGNSHYAAKDSLPPGTRMVALVGEHLVAVTTNGLWTAPAK